MLTETEETTLSDLAERIAGLENDKPAHEINSQERKRVYVGLYQTHLPRMDAADVIEFDVDRKSVGLGPNAEQLAPYLELCDGTRSEDSGARNWAPFYLGATLLGGFVLLVQTLLFPIAWLSAVVVDGLLLTYFGLSVAHARYDGVRFSRGVGR